MFLRTMVSIAAWFMLADALGAQTQLRWQFTVGESYEAKRVVAQKQSVTAKGKAFSSDRHSTWNVHLHVKSKVADAFLIRATLRKVEHRIEGSPEEKLDPKLDRKMQGSEFDLTVTPAGQLTKMDGYDAFLKRGSGDDPIQLKALRATLPLESVRGAFVELFGPLPEKEVRPTDTWTRDLVEPIPHFGSLRSRLTFQLGKPKNALEQIRISAQTTYESPKDDKSVVFRVIKGSITSEKGAGLLVFDNANGRLVQYERRISLCGSVVVEVLEREQTMEFSSETNLRISIKRTMP